MKDQAQRIFDLPGTEDSSAADAFSPDHLIPETALPFEGLEVRKIGRAEARAFIIEHHYSRGCSNAPMAWGLYRAQKLLGVCVFATPCSEAVRASVFGADYVDWVTELHRLAVVRPHHKHLTSWFASRAMKALKKYRPEIRAVVSFADATEGHVGTIYQALGFIYTGTTARARFYRDQAGTLRHPRQNGVNISKHEAATRGWTEEWRDAKYRYIKLIPRSKRERKLLPKALKFEGLPYPRKTENTSTAPDGDLGAGNYFEP